MSHRQDLYHHYPLRNYCVLTIICNVNDACNSADCNVKMYNYVLVHLITSAFVTVSLKVT